MSGHNFHVDVDSVMDEKEYIDLLKRQGEAIDITDTSRSIPRYAEIAQEVYNRGVQEMDQKGLSDLAFVFIWRCIHISSNVVFPRMAELEKTHTFVTKAQFKKFYGDALARGDQLVKVLLPELHKQHMQRVHRETEERRAVISKQLEEQSLEDERIRLQRLNANAKIHLSSIYNQDDPEAMFSSSLSNDSSNNSVNRFPLQGPTANEASADAEQLALQKRLELLSRPSATVLKSLPGVPLFVPVASENPPSPSPPRKEPTVNPFLPPPGPPPPPLDDNKPTSPQQPQLPLEESLDDVIQANPTISRDEAEALYRDMKRQRLLQRNATSHLQQQLDMAMKDHGRRPPPAAAAVGPSPRNNVFIDPALPRVVGDTKQQPVTPVPLPSSTPVVERPLSQPNNLQPLPPRPLPRVPSDKTPAAVYAQPYGTPASSPPPTPTTVQPLAPKPSSPSATNPTLPEPRGPLNPPLQAASSTPPAPQPQQQQHQRRFLHHVVPTPQQLSWRTQRWRYPRRPLTQVKTRRGLVNLGNTCYINSVLQVIAASHLGQFFLSRSFHQAVERVGAGRSAAALFSVLRELDVPAPYPATAASLKRVMGGINESFATTSQQDASEFLMALLSALHDDFNTKKGTKVPFKEIEHTKRSDDEICADYRAQFNLRNSATPITDMVSFWERSIYVCHSCKTGSKNFTEQQVLSLEIPGGAQCIEDCLTAYTRIDVVTDVHCDNCGAKSTKASKGLSFHTLPKLLFVTLKRFRNYGNFNEKIDADVAFQEVLDLAPFMLNPPQDARFRLVGVINHSGNMSGGHYVADTRGATDGLWYQFSDETVRNVETPDFSRAFILVYHRCG